MGSLYIDAQGCVPVLLENLYGMSCVVCLALELAGPWVVLGFSVCMEVSSYRLMFPGVRCSMMFSKFGLKPPASGFQSYFYSSLKTSPSIQHH